MQSSSIVPPYGINPIRRVVFVTIGIIGFGQISFAQELSNPSFEMNTMGTTGQPFVAGSEASAITTGWQFGVGAGICRQGVAYAEGLAAAEGSYVAFVQGDSTQHAPESPGSVFGAEIANLTPGSEYEIQWAQASRSSDAGHGELTVIVTSPADPTTQVMLAEHEPVENKGEWVIEKHTFVATDPTMRVNFVHSIPDLQEGETGSQSTLLDDLQIRPVE